MEQAIYYVRPNTVPTVPSGRMKGFQNNTVPRSGTLLIKNPPRYPSLREGRGRVHYWLGIAASLWALVWKGIALWKAAGKKELWWFIALLVINTLGIFEILYIFIFSDISLQRKAAKG